MYSPAVPYAKNSGNLRFVIKPNTDGELRFVKVDERNKMSSETRWEMITKDVEPTSLDIRLKNKKRMQKKRRGQKVKKKKKTVMCCY